MNAFEDYAFPVIDNLPESKLPIPEDNANDEDSLPRIWDILSEMRNTEHLSSVDPAKGVHADDHIFEAELGENDIDAIERGIWIYGIEFLAFYKSIHYLNNPPFPGRWGIFLFNHSILYLKNEIELYYPGQFQDQELIRKAFLFLHRHERFHFHFDAWAISHEAIQKKPLYVNYQRSIYQPFFPQKIIFEEALANRHVLDSLKREEVPDFMYDFMDRQPEAYKNYVEDKNELRAHLSAQLLYGKDYLVGKPTRQRPDQAPWIANGRGYLLRDENCPVYIIHKVTPTKLISPSVGAPGFHENTLFIENYLAGRFDRESDHKYYRIDNGELLKVPNPHGGKDRLKPGEFKGTLKTAGMQMKEYRKERSRTRSWKKNVPRNTPKPAIK